MTAVAPDLPDQVRRNLAALGGAGETWLARLPAVAADLERRWAVAIGATMPNATEADVAESVTATGARGREGSVPGRRQSPARTGGAAGGAWPRLCPRPAIRSNLVNGLLCLDVGSRQDSAPCLAAAEAWAKAA
jgi:hypothetical protein